MSQAPRVSVVVALIAGERDRLAACLEALHRQEDAPPFEILVPYDDAVAQVATLVERYPDVRFLRAEGLDTADARGGASREHHDSLRTLGLRQARADVIALTEDHAVAGPRWVRGNLEALEALPEAGAVGGAVECKSDHVLNWAVWFCDFGRYANPLPEGPAAWVSDSNVFYRREALERVGDAWKDDYHETAVHDALASVGHPICLTPRTEVWQARAPIRLGRALRERYVWGRSYAATRVQHASAAARLPLALASPLLAGVLTWRVVRTALMRRRHLGRLAQALPAIVLLHAVWAFGEGVGYATGRAGSG